MAGIPVPPSPVPRPSSPFNQVNEWLASLAAGRTSRRRLDDRRRAAEASRPLEDVLLAEYEALFESAQRTPRDPAIEPDEITDLTRIAEYLYEAHLRDRYGNYGLPITVDGPRAVLRARIWDALDPELQRRLEIIALGNGERPAFTGAHGDAQTLLGTDDTAKQLAAALNIIIRGEPLAHASEAKERP